METRFILIIVTLISVISKSETKQKTTGTGYQTLTSDSNAKLDLTADTAIIKTMQTTNQDKGIK